MVGQTLSESCRYSNKIEHPYEAKIWRQIKASKSIWLVSTSKPRTLAQDSCYTIWDDPSSGFTNVNMAELKGKASGSYQCAAKGSKGGIIPYKKIHLLVFPVTLAFSVTTSPSSTSDSEHRKQLRGRSDGTSIRADFTREADEVCPRSLGYFRKSLHGHLWVLPPQVCRLQIWVSSPCTPTGLLVPPAPVVLCSHSSPICLPPPLLAGSFLSP
ncbi:trem-like transcript 4 protein [Hippopotamus amphibius kiboko]|uniref:trem-like transcript 4 protein n=1 Tax=Hippopotamus amphibius kiboko TaxID=575201 RepID=UPI002594A0B5|nr:trem-like transcript 4 protein [Hippopotamus amphibius kiboko]